MLFNLESDTGTRITGYLVPDAFSAVPKVRIVAAKEEVLVFEANENREALVVAGRHETGKCGFSIDAKMLPNLKDLHGLEIYDAETGILVYRRSQSHFIRKKVLRMETHLFPLWQFDESLRSNFQYFAKGIENHGSETVAQMFLLNKVGSVYLSGRILYKNYAYYIENGFSTLFLMQDPYEELAERLLILSKISRVGAEHFGLRDALGMSAAVAFAEELLADDKAMEDLKVCRRLLQRMPLEVAAVLSNPVVRELTASTPDEMPGRNAVASALDLLSGVSVLGLRAESDLFFSAVAEFLELSSGEFPSLPRFGKVPVLASKLRESGEVDVMLEMDLAVYNQVLEAKGKLAFVEGVQ